MLQRDAPQPASAGRALTQEMVFMRTKCNRMDLIKNLNLWGNNLQDISVIQSMPNLEVLSLSVNQVSTLIDLQYCPKLSELYLRKNEIFDLAEILHLKALRRMKVLWLADNPCANLPYYRQYVLHHLPGLTKIDSQDVTEEERRAAQMNSFYDVDTCVGGKSPGDHGYGMVPIDSPFEEPSSQQPGLVWEAAGGHRNSFPDQRSVRRSGSDEVEELHMRRPASRASSLQEEDAEGEHRRQMQYLQMQADRQRQADRRQPLIQRQPSVEESYDAPGHGRQGSQWSRSAPLRERMDQDDDLAYDDRPLPQRKPSRQAWEPRTPPRGPAAAGDSPNAGSWQSSGGRQQQRRGSEEAVGQSWPPSGEGSGGDSGRCSPNPEGPGGPSEQAAVAWACGAAGGVWAQPQSSSSAWNDARRADEMPASAALRRSMAGRPDPGAGGEIRRMSAVEQERRMSGFEQASDNGRAPRDDNILCAVLSLVKELDAQGLGLVRRAVDQRLAEF